jgi:DNA primase
MEINEIKGRLPITTVLAHYTLNPDKNHRLCCPFHEDKTPSMQVYPKTNTVFCFSSNCQLKGKAIDSIDFIMYKEKLSKHEALKKADSLINIQTVNPVKPMQATPTKEKNLTDTFKQLQINLGKSAAAQAYLKERGLAYSPLGVGGEVGYNVTTTEGLKHCVVFALRNKNNEVTGLYGRSIYNNSDKKHFYLKESSGLYPNYPHPDTTKLIIAESIIDTASLQQIPLITDAYSLLACYGTNRLNEEMKAAISELKHLKEIVFAFDNDEAGNKAVEKYTEELNQLLNTNPSPSPVERDGVRFSKLNLPCKDVNETLVAHNEEAFTHLLNERKILFQLKKEEQQQTLQTPKQSTKPTPTAANTLNNPTLNFPTLNCSNPYKLIFTTQTALYYIKGGVDKIMNKLNVTIEIVNKQLNESINKRRFKVDLYDNKQVEKMIVEASEQLQINNLQLQLEIELLIGQLDEHREKELQLMNEEINPENEQYSLNTAERSEAMQLATDKNIIHTIQEKLTQTGIIGEEENKIFLFIIGVSHIQENPLNALIQGSSGSGKTNLLKGIFRIMPDESKKIYSRCSEKMLYNVPKYYFKNKLICFEDVDGLGEEAEYAWRELVSNGELISGVSYKDEKGNIGIKELVVYGPITSIACTTKGAIYADNMSRLFLIAIDESKAQTKKINDYQAKEAAGLINKQEQKNNIRQLQNYVRILQPYQVHNPHATKLKLPEGITDERRLYRLYLYFIDMITVLHQYQRKKNQQGKLIATKQDCQIAKDLLFECIMLKMDELDGSLRQFFERLKDHIQKQNNTSYEFTQREIREALHIKKTALSYYINELVHLEYVQQTSSHINKGNKYRIIHFDNYRKMREDVKAFLQLQLQQLED